MDFLGKKLATKYPDIATIQEIYQELRSKEGREEQEGDSKYRPLPLLLAVLYRLQERQEAGLKEGGQTVEEGGEEVLELLAFYWHHQHKGIHRRYVLAARGGGPLLANK